ncbi:helix-turn-helix domain-containing protein [Candidatus Peregrinibacteria bacterium]|nr:helix-turn-helix domain-containing protein [Candidatus Peregrinibacteria bacterium]
MNQCTSKHDPTGKDLSSGQKTILCGRGINLKEREHELLIFLLKNRNKLINRLTLLECVWNFHSPNSKGTLENHIGSLRKKLSHLKNEMQIETVYGHGYRLKTEWNITANP